ncbi:lytic transglycosylase domain-containing protein [Pseudooceanicola sp.]|uniref:lytic transglycosylase domain-containing protein n=1 Tax=Pseudooceanicola sp. TaxID=1914328 RepID=UPI000C0988A1|nr:lytic murein transglycosylase [Pseudooceanicola sp.]
MRQFARCIALAGGVAVMSGLIVDVRAEAPGFKDFSFKRVKPPKSSAGQRITVQITDPLPVPKKKSVSDVKDAVVIPVAAAARPVSSLLDWFWDDISPALSDSAPDRLTPALVRLSNPPSGASVPEPRLDALLSITQRHGADILLSTVGTRVSPALALAVIAVESGGRADAVSHAGAQGMMQLMPAAAERFGVVDRLNPSDNIRGGVKYLDRLMKDFDNDPVLALAGYNAGENAVRRHGGVPPYAETRNYVPKVLAAFNVARGLCLTPPVLATDGCAFRQP